MRWRIDMHELSIALSILDLVEEEAERRGPGNVVAVHLKLGPLSGVMKEALASAYDLARESSAVPLANLVIEETSITVFCPTCGEERNVLSPQQMRCSECGTVSGDVIHGRELEVVALEIEA